MKKHVVLFIDAGHLRAQAGLENQIFNVSFVKEVVKLCVFSEEEELYKVLYYDCPPYQGHHIGPISGKEIAIAQPDNYLSELETLPYFAVRKGSNKFRGWRRKGDHVQQAPEATNDNDFKPDIQQKGVDIRIALDIASIANNKYVQRIILMSNDADLIPAMKYARMAGIQIVLIKLPGKVNQAPLLPHTDLRRFIIWPGQRKRQKNRNPK
jgi:uncharacterized LabA/DUF88 family protein